MLLLSVPASHGKPAFANVYVPITYVCLCLSYHIALVHLRRRRNGE